ncbi:MAG TPA: DUF1476 domain-containing protein [Stellaceae bacterium]|nr:DUF1476 domain-containing protein [Stellaceae bacterium]
MVMFCNHREHVHERKFAEDHELAFKVAARRNALLGRWVTAQTGLSGSRADAYVKDLVESDAGSSGPQVVAIRVMDDLVASGVSVSREEIGAAITRFTARARAEIVRSALRKVGVRWVAAAST